MTRRIQLPPEYRAPLRSRAAIADFLVEAGSDHHRSEAPVFCWDVKVDSANFSYDHLWQIWESSGEVARDDPMRAADWQAVARKRHARMEKKDEMYWFSEAVFERVREEVFDDGYWASTPHGDEFEVEWEYLGHSAGYLALRKWKIRGSWNSENFQNKEMDQGAWRQYFAGEDPADRMDYPRLLALYRFVVMLEHDLQREQCQERVEFRAAADFFDRICDSIPKRLEKKRRRARLRRIDRGLAGATGAMQPMRGTHA